MKSFEERLNRLENLSEKLREGKIPLEEAVSIFEEGMKLAKDLEKELAKIDLSIQTMKGRIMLTGKRVIIATICGIICGFICMGLASSNPDPAAALTTMVKLSIIIGRAMLGFVIGISALRLRWWLHGIVLGIICSIPMAMPVMNNMGIFIGTFIMGIIYGLLIELVTSVLFKAKAVGA